MKSILNLPGDHMTRRAANRFPPSERYVKISFSGEERISLMKISGTEMSASHFERQVNLSKVSLVISSGRKVMLTPAPL